MKKAELGMKKWGHPSSSILLSSEGRRRMVSDAVKSFSPLTPALSPLRGEGDGAGKTEGAPDEIQWSVVKALVWARQSLALPRWEVCRRGRLHD